MAPLLIIAIVRKFGFLLGCHNAFFGEQKKSIVTSDLPIRPPLCPDNQRANQTPQLRIQPSTCQPKTRISNKMEPEDEVNRSPPRKKPCGSETQLPSVIIKLTDGKSTFKTMEIAERMKIQNIIISAVGEPRESSVLMGEDLAPLNLT